MSLPDDKLSGRIDQGIKLISRVANKWIDNGVSDEYVSVLLDLKHKLYDYRYCAFDLEDQIADLKELKAEMG